MRNPYKAILCINADTLTVETYTVYNSKHTIDFVQVCNNAFGAISSL